MKKVSTHCLNKRKESKANHVSPRQQTLDLLSQFARAYHAEATLEIPLNGIVLN